MNRTTRLTLSSAILALALSGCASTSAVDENDGTWDRIEGNWSQLSGDVKAQWGDLTDDELMQLDGKRESLVGLVQEKYGIAKDAAEEQVDSWADALSD